MTSMVILILIQYMFTWYISGGEGTNIVQQRLVNTTSAIITKTPYTTMTSCLMRCSTHSECTAVGFKTDPMERRGGDCMLLRSVEEYGVERKDGLMLLFVIIDDQKFSTKKPALPDCPVDGGYSEWSEYTACSASCDQGMQNRTRQCSNPFPRGTGDNCSKLGSSFEQRNCTIKPCPVNGVWSSWTSYGECTRTCETSIRIRTRACDNPTPKHGGRFCKGASTEYTACNKAPCPSVAGGWGKWTFYGACSRSCGDGKQTRNRRCDNPKPENGGAHCAGNESQVINCIITPCAPDFCMSAITNSNTTTLNLHDMYGKKVGSTIVDCKFDKYTYTEFTHNATTMRRFDSSNYLEPSPINYGSTSVPFIRDTIQQFDYCVQYFKFKEFANLAHKSCFTTWNGTKFCMDDQKCKGCDVMKNTRVVTSARAYVEDKDVLPFTGMHFGDSDESHEFMEMTLEPLRCRYKYTEFHHDASTMRRFERHNYQDASPIRFLSQTHSAIRNLVLQYDYCIQYFNFKEYANMPKSSCFQTLSGRDFCMTDSRCKGCGVMRNRNEVVEALAYVDDKDVLPFIGMSFKDSDQSHEYMEMTLQPLRCRNRYTEYSHDALKMRRFTKTNYREPSLIRYPTPSILYIRNSIRQFDYCVQNISLKSSGNAPNKTCFITWDNKRFCMGDRECINCDVIRSNNVTTAQAYVENKEFLPFIGMEFKDNNDSSKSMEISLQNLKCRANYTEYTHDATITRRFAKHNYGNPSLINYDVSFVRDKIEKFEYCVQFFQFNEFANMPSSSCFTTWKGTKLCMNSAKCHGCDVMKNKNNNVSARAFVDDKDLLPFISMQFKDCDENHEYMEMTLEPLRCRNNFTEFTHDALKVRRFTQANFDKTSPIYYDSYGVQYIRDAIKHFTYCVQYFHFKERENHAGSSCFITWRGTKFCMNDPRCKGCDIMKNTKVNNSARAYVEDKELLPFVGMEFKDNDDSHEFMEMTLEKLKCR